MKKRLLLFASIALAALTFTANATIQIRVTKSTMSPLYLYAWTGSGDGAVAVNGAWPGKEMPLQSDGSYAVTLDVTEINIIFNNNNGTQTNNIEGIKEDACFEVNADGSYKRFDCQTGNEWEEPVEPEVEKVNVKFAVEGWDEVHVYAWEGEGESAVELNGAWPGAAVSAVDGWFVFALKKGANIIFNNGKDGEANIKTGNIKGVEADVCYVWADGKENLDEDCDGKVGEEPIVEPEKVYSVVGHAAILNGDKDWDVESTANDMSLVYGVYSLIVEKEIKAGTYEFKVAVNHDWKECYPAQGNESLEIKEDGMYRILYVYEEGGTAPTADVTLITTPDVEKLYVIGEVEGNQFQWAANIGTEMKAEGGSLFTLETQVGKEGSDFGYFAFVTELAENEKDWDSVNAHRYGPETDGVLLEDKTPTLLAKADAAFKVETGRYVITVDMAELMVIIMKITTDVENLESGSALYVTDNMLVAKFNGRQTVAVYNTTGQMVAAKIGDGEARFPLTSGMYVVMIGNRAFKAVVK